MAGHTHGATSGRLLWISLALTITFVAVELFYGLRAHSLALVSDAGHNASDALALGLAAYAVWVARRPAGPGNTFGYHRVAILTAWFNAAALVVIAIMILVEAWNVFLHPQPHIQAGLMMGVAAVAFVMNTVIAYWLSGDSHNSLNARAAYIHMAGDALSSLGVLIAGVVVHFTGWTLADPIVSVMIAAFILYSSWEIIIDATNVLLEGTPKGMDITKLVAAIKSVACVRDVHDLHVWTVGDGIIFLSCHIVLPEEFTVIQSSTVVSAVNHKLHDDFGIGHATIQAEIGDCNGCNMDPEELFCFLESHSRGCGHDH
ncbi:MAG: Cobalt-zinc-cadmium resistance protein CzcD [Capsulimonas sp.]|nr:Cobalt-zinc-cadmium resistance protein CzcD [Capsulimonas sp.]